MTYESQPAPVALPGRTACGVGNDTRLFINAIRFHAKTGITWADMPTSFGKSNSLWQRHNRWCENGVWAKIAAALRDDDTDGLTSTAVVSALMLRRARKNKSVGSGGQTTDALGRSRGGFGSKIHGDLNSLGHSLKFELTGSLRG